MSRRAAREREYRVLIAEDDYKFRAGITLLLEPLGLVCVGVEDGLLAAELLEDASEHFDLVITDFRMPRRSGWHVIDAARTHRGDELPIIMQTAESQYPDVYQRAETLGVALIAKDDILALLVPAVLDALGLA
jgi:CheY-like chemotaxis protein